jgi:hypothetical protein
MPAPTVPVTVTLLSSDGGAPYVGVTVRARLDVNEVYEGFLISEVAEAVTDADGIAVLDLFPNAPSPAGLGTQGSTYRVWAAIPNARSLYVDARIPNQACNLEDVLVNSDATGLTDWQLALSQAQTYALTARADATATSADAEQTAGDRVQTGLDRTAVAVDRAAVDTFAAQFGSVAAAIAAAQTAENNAETAETNAETAQAAAEAARDIALAAIADTGEAVIDALIDDETTAIAISAQASSEFTMKVVDATTPANNQVGALSDILAAMFQPKLVVSSDGRTLEYSPHNLAFQTSAPGSNVTAATVTANQSDSDGTTTAAKLTATGVTSGFTLLAVSTGDYKGQYHTQEWIVQAGTAPFIFIGFHDGAAWNAAWFNATTWAVGTTDAGVTASSHSTRADGTALPAGFRRIVATYRTTTNTFNMWCAMADADASSNVTIGRTFTAEKPFLHLGLNAMDYFENTGATARTGTPIDYSAGGPHILVEPARSYTSLWSDDQTQAAWVKSASMAAALTTTGPHGEPCSTLTASAANQTCIQSLVSAPANQVFAPYVRRRTGSGTISITTDNGGSWTDITSLINSTYYVRIPKAATTNPAFGFKIATSGDAIDVSMAQITPLYLCSPSPTFGVAGSRIADAFIVPTSLVTAGTAWTYYLDGYRVPTPFIESDNWGARVGKADFSQESVLLINTADGSASFWVSDGVTPKSYPIYSLDAEGERIEVTAKVESAKHIMSINGEPSAQITGTGMPTVVQLKLAHNAPLLFRRLLMVPRAVDRDDIRTWRYSGRVRNSLLDCVTVAWDRDASVANATMNREPTMCVLSDDGTTADVAVFWMQKHDTGHHVEAPTRLVQRNYRVDKEAGTISALTAATVIQQQAGWTIGEGQLHSPVAFTIPSGTNAGRVVLLFTGMETATFATDKRSIYKMICEPNGDVRGDPTQWSTPTKIVDAPALTSYVTDPSGCGLILPPSHSVAPNRLLTNYYINTSTVVPLYSDDFGTTWTSGTSFNTADGPNESSMSLWPDGTVNLLSRVVNVPVTRRNWAKSTNGGASFVDQGILASLSFSECSAGAAQLDPSGLTGPYGKTAVSHPTGTNRYSTKIVFATDSAMTFGSGIQPFGDAEFRYFGYSSLKSLFGGTHMLLAAEGGSVSFTTDNTVYLGLVEAP